MGLTERLKTLFAPEERAQNQLSFDAYMQLLNSFSFNGVTYTLPNATQEEIGGNFAGLARNAYKSNGVVFACMAVRQLLFEEARFAWRQRNNGRAGNLFTDQNLKPLQQPWPGATTRDLLGKVIQHADLAGNAYIARMPGGRLKVLRPDWVKIIGGIAGDPQASVWEPDAEVLGYIYQPGGYGSGIEPVTFLADEVAHFAPYPDPEAVFIGMSWLTPVIREVMADKAATEHKLMFFENSATPQLAVKLPVPNLEEMQKWIALFRENHEGAVNAYKTLYLGEGADVTVVGKDLGQMDFKATQGAGETRIAAAARVPPVIVGLSEGLQGSSLNEGNYAMARRHLGDGCIRPLWGKFAGCIQQILDQPNGGQNTNAELWYDDHEVAFLREDLKDEANIQFINSQALNQLTQAGFEPDSAVEYIATNDLSALVHSGMLSVQLQKPGENNQSQQPPDAGAAAAGDSPQPKNTPPAGRSLDIEDRQLQIHLHDERSIQVSPPDVRVEIAERAFVAEAAKVDVHVDAPPPADTKVEIAEGAFRVEAPPPAEVNVTVEAPPPAETKVEIAEGAVRVEPAKVEVNVEAPPPSEPSRVEFAEGAFRVEAPPPAEVSVTVEPELRAELTISDQAVDALRQQPDVVVNVQPTPVTVENTVNVPETPVNVNLVDEPRDAEIQFKRGRNGQIESAKLTEE